MSGQVHQSLGPTKSHVPRGSPASQLNGMIRLAKSRASQNQMRARPHAGESKPKYKSKTAAQTRPDGVVETFKKKPSGAAVARPNYMQVSRRNSHFLANPVVNLQASPQVNLVESP